MISDFCTVLGVPSSNTELFGCIQNCQTEEDVLSVLKNLKVEALLPLISKMSLKLDDPHLSLKIKVFTLVQDKNVLDPGVKKIETFLRQNHLLSKIPNDMVLRLDSEINPCNKLTMVSEIPYFAGAFAAGMNEAKMNEFILAEDISADIYKKVVEYASCDDMERLLFLDDYKAGDTQKVYNILVLANLWNMSTLVRQCEQWILDFHFFILEELREFQNEALFHGASRLQDFLQQCISAAYDKGWDILDPEYDFSQISSYQKQSLFTNVRKNLSLQKPPRQDLEREEEVRHPAWHPTGSDSSLLKEHPPGSYFFCSTPLPDKFFDHYSLHYKNAKGKIESLTVNSLTYSLAEHADSLIFPVKCQEEARTKVLDAINENNRAAMETAFYKWSRFLVLRNETFFDKIKVRFFKNQGFIIVDEEGSRDCQKNCKVSLNYERSFGALGNFVRDAFHLEIEKHLTDIENHINSKQSMENSHQGEKCIHRWFFPEHISSVKEALRENNYHLEEYSYTIVDINFDHSSAKYLIILKEQDRFAELPKTDFDPLIHPLSVNPEVILIEKPIGTFFLQIDLPYYILRLDKKIKPYKVFFKKEDGGIGKFNIDHVSDNWHIKNTERDSNLLKVLLNSPYASLLKTPLYRQ